jgi:hypothetical protein
MPEDDLAERLRDYARDTDSPLGPATRAVLMGAAAELERLSAERDEARAEAERLREAIGRALDLDPHEGSQVLIDALRAAHPETERAPEDKRRSEKTRWVQPEAFCEQPRCQAKNDGACHVPENCGHFQPKGRWEADRAPEDAA